MKKKMIGLLLLLATSPHFAFAAPDTCKDKIAAFNKKIEQAKKFNNRKEMSRLNIARNRVKTNCNKERQAQRANQNVTRQPLRVKKVEPEPQEAQQALKEAKTEGHRDNIAEKSEGVKESHQ